ncbi:hypothetical protein [Serratia plymuthica]|uniref:hypothetical protein n=1 Tax=Serratia plymuthica TaxID=82996 RepID=UPI0008FB4547|nr:hypothetical protein [Serratia plymuthica]NIC28596.1 hypothetical protein [Serratia plymuthica]UJE00547.1 hypothetical protein FS592_18985 [Serratia plymuthica]
MKNHPNKHIQAALSYAISQGWFFRSSNEHAFGRLQCSLPEHREHMMSIWSTPKNPEQHAMQIRRKVDQCLAQSGKK